MRRAIALASGAAALAPRLAEACPACAGNGGYGLMAIAMFAGFLALPFFAFGAVWWMVRRHERAQLADQPR